MALISTPLPKSVFMRANEVREPMQSLAAAIDSLCDLKAKLPPEYDYIGDTVDGQSFKVVANKNTDHERVIKMIEDAHGELMAHSRYVHQTKAAQ